MDPPQSTGQLFLSLLLSTLMLIMALLPHKQVFVQMCHTGLYGFPPR